MSEGEGECKHIPNPVNQPFPTLGFQMLLNYHTHHPQPTGEAVRDGGSGSPITSGNPGLREAACCQNAARLCLLYRIYFPHFSKFSITAQSHFLLDLPRHFNRFYWFTAQSYPHAQWMFYWLQHRLSCKPCWVQQNLLPVKYLQGSAVNGTSFNPFEEFYLLFSCFSLHLFYVAAPWNLIWRKGDIKCFNIK